MNTIFKKIEERGSLFPTFISKNQRSINDSARDFKSHVLSISRKIKKMVYEYSDIENEYKIPIQYNLRSKNKTIKISTPSNSINRQCNGKKQVSKNTSYQPKEITDFNELNNEKQVLSGYRNYEKCRNLLSDKKQQKSNRTARLEPHSKIKLNDNNYQRYLVSNKLNRTNIQQIYSHESNFQKFLNDNKLSSLSKANSEKKTKKVTFILEDQELSNRKTSFDKNLENKVFIKLSKNKSRNSDLQSDLSRSVQKNFERNSKIIDETFNFSKTLNLNMTNSIKNFNKKLKKSRRIENKFIDLETIMKREDSYSQSVHLYSAKENTVEILKPGEKNIFKECQQIGKVGINHAFKNRDILIDKFGIENPLFTRVIKPSQERMKKNLIFKDNHGIAGIILRKISRKQKDILGKNKKKEI